MKTLTNLGNNVWFINNGNKGYMTTDKKMVRQIAIILYLSNELNEQQFNLILT